MRRIKRILPALLLLLTVLCLLPAALAEGEENLLTNGSFELLDGDGLPSGWNTEAYINKEGVTLYRLAEGAHGGQNAVLVENLDDNDARFAQRVKVQPNTMYRLSGWIKVDKMEDSGRGANLSVEGVHVYSQCLYEATDDWTYVELYGETGEDQDTLTVFARVGGYSGMCAGKAAFDDLSLTQVDELPEGVYARALYVPPQEAVYIPPVEEAEDAAPAPAWPWLLVIAGGYAAAAIWLMRHLQLNAQEERLRDAGKTGMPLFVMAGLAAAALLRLAIALNVVGYQVDVNCFTAWGNTMRNVGPWNFYQSNWCDYTPGYIYIMGLNGIAAQALDGVVGADFVHKLVPMACDLLAAWLIGRLAVQQGSSRKQAGIMCLLVAFNPAVILNSAAWCQIDSVLCLGLMAVAYLALQRKWALVLPVYVGCALIKPQALMLGFLGLAAIVMEVLRQPSPAARKQVLRQLGVGLGVSLVLALLIVLPFSPNQTSTAWLFELYGDTLASYPHATVNTANLYYLVGANWDDITNPADTLVCLFMAALCIAWGVYSFLLREKQRPIGESLRLPYLEAGLMAAFALAFLVMAMVGVNWLAVGAAAMALAFFLVLPMYIRGGKLEHLPLCGAVLFILLYVLGIKMHERYLFPALFLLGMAYAIRRDRRVLGLLIAMGCVLFVNEGIVLDNSIRLGSSMGHLNNDTRGLANLLSVMNVASAVAALWVCHRVCVMDAPVRLADSIGEPVMPVRTHEDAPCTPLTFKPDAKLGLNRKDALLIGVVTAIYSVVTLTTLGSTKAPQQPWKSTTYEEAVYIDLGQRYEDFTTLYFAQVSYDHFSIAVSDTGEEDDWSEEHWAYMAEGECFRWRYLTPHTGSGDDVSFTSADLNSIQKLSGQYVRITAQQIGLKLNEIIFRDSEGNVIPAAVIGAVNANEASPLYSDPAHLLDEQDTLEGEPSWWNSTYFDEIYHARTGFEHLNGTTPYETSHPPLGKVIMSWFIGLMGMTPFGWRFAGALCGILMLPAMYLLVKQLFKRTDLAFIGMSLMALDCMHLTQTQIATIDSYPVLFIILSYFFMLRFMQRDIVLDDWKQLLPELALSGFFMACGFASKWIGAYSGVGLAVLYFWTCFRHLRLRLMAKDMLASPRKYTAEERALLEQRVRKTVKRIICLCLWCVLFFVVVTVVIYLLSYIPHYAYRDFDSLGDFIEAVWHANFEGPYSMLGYHSEPDRGKDHPFYSPWYEWPLMMTPMYYASPSNTPEGWSYAIFCFGNPWVWVAGIAGVAYAAYAWLKRHRYRLGRQESTFQLYSDTWDVAPAFILIGLAAQYLPWVLVPRGTYIYHYFASVPFLILGIVLLIGRITEKHPRQGRKAWIIYLALCLVWFILLFPYASGVLTPEWWMDFIRDYPYINRIPNYWKSGVLFDLNALLEKIPVFPHVYH